MTRDSLRDGLLWTVRYSMPTSTDAGLLFVQRDETGYVHSQKSRGVELVLPAGIYRLCLRFHLEMYASAWRLAIQHGTQKAIELL